VNVCEFHDFYLSSVRETAREPTTCTMCEISKQVIDFSILTICLPHSFCFIGTGGAEATPPLLINTMPIGQAGISQSYRWEDSTWLASDIMQRVSIEPRVAVARVDRESPAESLPRVSKKSSRRPASPPKKLQGGCLPPKIYRENGRWISFRNQKPTPSTQKNKEVPTMTAS